MRLIDLILGVLFVLCVIVFGILILPLGLLPLPLLLGLFGGLLALIVLYGIGIWIVQTKWLHQIRRSLALILSCLLVVSSIALLEFDSTMSNMTNIDSTSANIRLLALQASDDDLQAYHKTTIGIFPSDYDGQQLMIDYLKKEKKITLQTKSYDDAASAYQGLLDHEIAGLLVSAQTHEVLQTKYDIKDQTRLVFEYTMETKSLLDLTTSPFHILINGIDQVGTAKAKARSDVTIIASVNLKTKQVLLTSIPRDAYVNNVCLANQKDKLTHISTRGRDCIIESLEQLLDITIPYSIVVSFTSLIEFIDAIGGLEVKVPMDFCEYDETKKNVVYLNQGLQVLNGKQALALARHRYTLYDGDVGRNRNQQLIINALLKKTASPKLLANIEQVLGLAGKTIQTNVATSQMYGLIRFQLEDTRPYLISNQSIAGYTDSAVTASLPYQKLSVIQLYDSSIQNASKAMKAVLLDIDLSQFTYNTNKKTSAVVLQETSGAKGTNQCHIR